MYYSISFYQIIGLLAFNLSGQFGANFLLYFKIEFLLISIDIETELVHFSKGYLQPLITNLIVLIFAENYNIQKKQTYFSSLLNNCL